MRKRIYATLAALLLVLGMSVSGAQPAQAATINGCNGESVCLYNWVNHNRPGGFWQRTFTDLLGSPNACTNLTNHYWHNGGIVDNTASSMYINREAWSSRIYRVTFYNWANCNSAGEFIAYGSPPNYLVSEPSLATLNDCDAGWCTSNWHANLKITSIQIWIE